MNQPLTRRARLRYRMWLLAADLADPVSRRLWLWCLCCAADAEVAAEARTS